MSGWSSWRGYAIGAMLVVMLGMAPESPARAAAASAEMKSRDGKSLGVIRLTETAAGLLISVRLKGLPPGPHGFHVHEVGKCDGDFASAGAIYNPLGAKHGFLNEDGPMAGDLPNLFVPANGDIEVEMLSHFLTLSKQADETLLDADGAAFILREKPDDYRTDPDGNTGARLACGVIAPAK